MPSEAYQISVKIKANDKLSSAQWKFDWLNLLTVWCLWLQFLHDLLSKTAILQLWLIDKRSGENCFFPCFGRVQNVDPDLPIACAVDETKLWLSPSEKQRRKPCSGRPVYQDLSTRHDWLVKNTTVRCQSRWKEIWNALPVIRSVRWGPGTRTSALPRRRYLPRFNYVCDTG